MIIGMTQLQDLLDRNRSFARTNAKDDVPAIPFVPNMQAYIITCIDPRVDPAHVLGLKLGDAIVDRNVGGRVTPAVLLNVGWVHHLHTQLAPTADWFEIAVIHHTDCGSGLFANEELRQVFADASGLDETELRRLAVIDPAETAAADVRLLEESKLIGSQVAISGYVYDVDTGIVTRVAGQ
ncbi:MAG: carbonic anhydrase [Mycobacterium sp.]|jgi:carbonic anhydrase|nr:carbonic anhydrase [Mycobacterium sp.]